MPTRIIVRTHSRRRFEVRAAIAANSAENFKSKSGARMVGVASAQLLASEIAATDRDHPKRGTGGRALLALLLGALERLGQTLERELIGALRAARGHTFDGHVRAL